MRNWTVLWIALTAMLGGCAGHSSKDIPAVPELDLTRYMGTWYEVARLPNSFERDMKEVVAEYSFSPGGGVRVVNRGSKGGQKTSIIGHAKWRGPEGTGELAVSFFQPFYSDYRVIMLDPEYQFSVVVGADRDDLWVLSRTKELPPETWRKIMDFLRSHRFPVERLIYSWNAPEM